MRVHRLEIEGFGPFRDLQVVDFDAVSHDGVFLIGGKTGAGKSSILDAICFALYGSVPRYDDGDKRLRSDYSALNEPTRVSLEFSSGGRTWRVERVPSYERLKKNGKGTTVSAAEARLAELQGTTWVDVAARAVDVGHALDPILGLTKGQFLQVILLAQGRFQEFLHAHNDDRQKLLRTLFGSRRFGEYQQILDDRRKASVESLALERRTLLMQLESAERLIQELSTEPNGVELTSTSERVGAVHTASLHAAHETELAAADEARYKAAHISAEAEHSLLVRQREKQDRRTRTRAELVALEERAPSIQAETLTLLHAQDAEALRPLIDAARRAVDAEASAAAASARALTMWVESGKAPAKAAELSALADDLVAQVGGLRASAEAESGQEARAAETTRATTALAQLEAQRQELRVRQGELPTLIGSLQEQVTATAAAAALLAPAEAATLTHRTRRDAAIKAESQRNLVREAESTVLSAGQALTAASAALDALRERRFRDHAGELAEHLVAGEPCVVCGSKKHPQPATRQGDPVTPDNIAAAEATKNAAIASSAAADDTLRAAEQLLATVAATAAGLSVTDAEALLQDAANSEAVARAAVGAHATLAAEHAKLTLELQRVATESRAADDRCSDAARTLAVAQEAERAAQQAIAAARGDFHSVADRINAVELTISHARALVDALRAHSLASLSSEAADAELSKGLADTAFADAEQATAALLPSADRAAIESRIRAYDVAVKACRATLLDLELEMLPEETISTEAASEDRAAAAAAWQNSVTRLAEVRAFAGQIAAASEAATFAHEAIAAATEDAQVIEELANTLAGRGSNTMKMDLETFVLAAELERIVEAANVRLSAMSEGRYALEHSDALAARNRSSGLGITIMDRFTGQSRPVQSLSGGETFLASLALALGLASVVTSDAGGIQLDTLFIDEGFGSLDRDTLDVAMRTLDELRAGGRTVGVISHVEAMQEDLPAGLIVEATPEGPSVIRLGARPV